ncbi:hypothetical protein [Corynebacterium epidermidicanis]|uniref:Uncharacterized protein n=1 Tax=Corynebacterium epidermidicanis TaxID=1050174 RepID=A0A0G3GSV9_9CORY|nr:hypothetical protein [Corynebacterium epidermidicanis]AKK03620.1 hypothetical protein CEPID_08870 [Corynebacterium epidermidicanis]
MPNNTHTSKTLLLDARRAFTLDEFFAQFSAAALPGRPVATNLDGFADYVRETRLGGLVLRGCRLSIPEYQRLADVARELGLKLTTIA